MKIRKALFWIVLLSATLFIFCGVSAFADSQYSAQLSDSRNVEEWYFDQSSGTLTIRKQGILIDYTPLDAFDAPWAGKKG